MIITSSIPTAHRARSTAGGFLFCEHHIVHVHGMVWHFVGDGKMFSCKGWLCNWEEIADFSPLHCRYGKNRGFFLVVDTVM